MGEFPFPWNKKNKEKDSVYFKSKNKFKKSYGQYHRVNIKI